MRKNDTSESPGKGFTVVAPLIAVTVAEHAPTTEKKKIIRLISIEVGY